jgi:hypothetical protein
MTTGAGSGAGTGAGNGANAGVASGNAAPSTGAASVGGAAGGTGQATGAGTPGSQAPAVAQDWTTGLADESKGFVQNKGWKNPGEVLESYRNLEKLVGAPPDRILQLPQGDDPQAMEGIYNRLGRPASPEGYKLPMPEKGGDPAFAKAASEIFHKAGLSEKQANEVVSWWNQTNAGAQEAAREAYVAKVTSEKQALQKEWGAAHEQNSATASRAIREFAVPPEAIDAIESKIGFAATVKLFHSIGSKLGEASFVAGERGRSDSALTPQQATSRIKELISDAGFVRRLQEGGIAEKNEWARLHHFQNGGVSSL